jgi:hypothetical protein
MSGELQTPDEDIRQDPGIPGKEAVSSASTAPLPDDKYGSAEDRLDDLDDEGHMSSPDSFKG